MNYRKYYINAIEKPLPEMQETFKQEQIYLSYKIGEAMSNVGLTKILEVGCGCRPLPDLAEIISLGRFTGIDNDAKVLSKTRKTDFWGRPLNNLELQIGDATQLPFSAEDEFAMVFSTYNLLGSGQTYEEREKIISEQYRILRPGGIAANIVWAQNTKTTEFLKRYYEHIGATVKDINMQRTVLDFGEVERPSVQSIINIYKRAGLMAITSTDLGPLWVAVAGKKDLSLFS